MTEKSKNCRHILIVEDDQSVRESLQEVLQVEGYEVKTAIHGDDALKQLRSQTPGERPCFILLDLMMPVMNGWEFLLAQRADPEISHIPVMISSAVGERNKVPGIQDFIKKPYDLDELLTHIKKHCD